MTATLKSLMIVCGEESGDMRAAPVLRALKDLCPGISFFGIGGDRCRKEGLETFADINDLAVIGFVEVLRNLSAIRKIFDCCVREAELRKPDAVLLVDYPGFNLRLARVLKSMGIRVFYYVSPQVWAWKAGRVKIIREVVDRMMVLFPFEPAFYQKFGYNVDFVGHPLVDEVLPAVRREPFLSSVGFDPRHPVVGLLPGSRHKEVASLLKDMLGAAALIRERVPGAQFLLLRARNLPQDIYAPQLAAATVPLKISDDYYSALNACDYAIVCSGTATLEAALLAKPMVVVYRTAWLTSFIVRIVIRIPWISLVNIVAGKRLVEELLQIDVNPRRISHEILKFVENKQKRDAVVSGLRSIRSQLGSGGASQRVAKLIAGDFSPAV